MICTSYILKPHLYSLLTTLLDSRIEKEINQTTHVYTENRGYLKMINAHMLFAVLEGHGYDQFPTQLFYVLSKRKTKIYLEFILEPSANAVRISKLLYNENPNRMGLMIKKSILSAGYKYGIEMVFEERFSKATDKSFFYFR